MHYLRRDGLVAMVALLAIAGCERNPPTTQQKAVRTEPLALPTATSKSPAKQNLDPTIVITPAARSRLHKMASADKKTNWRLRVDCVLNGYQGTDYKLFVETDPPGSGDVVYACGDIDCVYQASLSPIMQGLVIDWVEKENEAGLRIALRNRTPENEEKAYRWIHGAFEKWMDGRKLAVPQEDGKTYLQRRATFETKLTRSGAAPQPPNELGPAPEGAKEVSYPSGDLKLKAWLHLPEGDPQKKRPALVFFHGGFALTEGDYAECRPFIEAGYVVMTPALRGENGNRGTYEFCFGEVDDAKAAIRWLAKLPEVDEKRIFAFGHSSGGYISDLLTLSDDVPLRHSGSCGGLMSTATFEALPAFAIPFARDDLEEQRVRVLIGNIRDMRRRHFALVGDRDTICYFNATLAKREMGGRPSMLEIVSISGNHFSSLTPAMQKYLEITRRDP